MTSLVVLGGPPVARCEEGEEVCINYGEQRSNDTLLQFYGFVERPTWSFR